MFKKLKEVADGRVDLLTVRTTEAWLKREPAPTLYVNLNEEMAALTTSQERIEHFKTASEWLRCQIEKWKNPAVTEIRVASVEHPLEVVTGDIALTLAIEGKKYLVSFYRDISPIGWLIPGGCPRSREELFQPKTLAARECKEEALVSDTKGKIYDFYPSIAGIEESIPAWGLKPTEFVPLLPKEFPPIRGDAQNLIMRLGGREVKTKDVNVTIDPQTASVSITLYWEVTLPVKFEELRIFDGEKSPKGELINRTVRLTDQAGLPVAYFSRGDNISLAGWNSETTKERAIITS